jgi:FlaA1/EpsC-like NDP-sugar epimerase
MILAVKMTAFTVFRMFQGQWRHAGIEGVVVITKAVFVGSLSSGLLLWIIPQLGIRSVGVPAIDFLLLPFLILGERCSFQILKHLYISRNEQTSFNNLQSRSLPMGAQAQVKRKIDLRCRSSPEFYESCAGHAGFGVQTPFSDPGPHRAALQVEYARCVL